MSFPQFIQQRNYTLDIILSNFRGNSFTVSGNELKNRLLLFAVEVVNTNVDQSAPKLLDFNTSTTTLTIPQGNGAASKVTVDFGITVQDNQAGFRGGQVEAVHVDGLHTVVAYIYFEDEDTPVGMPIPIQSNLQFGVDSPAGRYELKVALEDRVRNKVTFQAAQLLKSGFSSNIEVVAV